MRVRAFEASPFRSKGGVANFAAATSRDPLKKACLCRTIDGEVGVESKRPRDFEAFHDRKTGAIDQAEILVAILLTDSPSQLQILRRDFKHGHNITSDTFPEFSLGGRSKSMMDQQPAFDEDEIGSDKIAGSEVRQKIRLGCGVISITAIRHGIKRPRVNEGAHWL